MMASNEDSAARDYAIAVAARTAARAARMKKPAFAERWRIDGYEPIRILSRGGQGIVYQAIQLSTGREVAVKMLRYGSFASPSEKARFEREIRALAQLRHPNIVTIHDSGSVDDLPYIVMDYVSGVPLNVFIEEQSPTRQTALKLLISIAEAVQAAHVRGIIHRDLKSANILVDDAGTPFVLDFGLAKLTGGDHEGSLMTETGQFVGSLPWASPEQACGAQADVDVRSDVYALGVIAWLSLTGSFPYDVTGSYSTVLENISNATPSLPSRSRAGIPRDLETVLRRCLAKEPDRRYQNAGELAEDLRNVVERKPIQARRDSSLYVLGKMAARHRMAFALAVGIVVIAFGSAIGFALMYRHAAERLRLAGEKLDSMRRGVFRQVPTLPSFEDGFNDGKLDPRFIATPYDQVREHRGMLELIAPQQWDSFIHEQNMARYYPDMTQYVLRGDFEITVDFRVLSTEPLTRGAHHFGIAIADLNTGQWLGIVKQHREVNPVCAGWPEQVYYLHAFSFKNDCAGPILATTDAQGRLQLARRGSRLVAHVFQEDDWLPLGEAGLPDGDVTFMLFAGGFVAEQALRVAFDNLVVKTTSITKPECLAHWIETFDGAVIDTRFVFAHNHNYPGEFGGRLHMRKQNGFVGELDVRLDPARYRLCGDFRLAVDFGFQDVPDVGVGEYYLGLQILSVANRQVLMSLERMRVLAGDENAVANWLVARPGPRSVEPVRKITDAEPLGNLSVERTNGVLHVLTTASSSSPLATVAYDQPVTFRLYTGSTTPERPHGVWFDNLGYEPLNVADE